MICEIVDSGLKGTRESGLVVRWDSFEVSEGEISLPRESERQADHVKQEFIQWSYDFPKTRIGGKTIKSRLELEKGLSFWWFTLVCEKSPLKSPELVDIFRLRTLEEILEAHACDRVVYRGSRYDIHLSLSKWCHETGRKYGWAISIISKLKAIWNPSKPWIRRFPHPIQAAVYLIRFLILNRAFFASRNPARQSMQPLPISIVSYFPNVDLTKLSQGNFRSNYWNGLHDLFDGLSGPINWVWFFHHAGGMTPRKAVEHRDHCAKADPENRYFFVQEFLTLRGLANVISGWARTYAAARSLKAAEGYFRLPNSKINFFPIWKFGWHSSLKGHTAITGWLWISLFQELGTKTPATKLGLYVWENQPWESALIHAWRQAGCQQIFGYQHSALPPLVLRAFDDPRSFEETDRAALFPDRLIANGPGSLSLMARSGTCRERLTTAEAVRYQYLLDWKRPTRERTGKTILVTTGICAKEARRQIALLRRVVELHPNRFRILLKAHPFLLPHAFTNEDFERLNPTVIDHTIHQAIDSADWVFTANMSAVAVETLMAGVPTAVHVPPDALNLSPLFNDSRVAMIYTAEDLERFLTEAPEVAVPEPYFELDHSLTKWRGLLKDYFKAETRLQ